MPTVTIPISDELATRLQVAFGTLVALRDATRERWRQEVMETHLAGIRQTATIMANTNIETQVTAAKTALELLL